MILLLWCHPERSRRVEKAADLRDEIELLNRELRR